MIETQIPGYDIMSVLGRGGMGIVCRAVQTSLGRPVALKLLEPRLASDPEFVRRFQQEAATAAALDHPHIVRVFDFGQAGDTYFIAMQLVRGEPLDMRLRRGAMPPQEAGRILAQMCEALEYAHAQGVVHRDIKPGNIMIQPDESVVIMDFGLARAAHSPVLTGARVSLGTPGYMSPEQCRGEKADWRADLYSLGVVVFEMLTGRRPFDGDNPLAIYYQHVNEPPPPLTERCPGLNPALDPVVRRAMEKDPAARYQHASEFAAAFAAAMETVPEPLEPEPEPPEALPVVEEARFVPPPAEARPKARQMGVAALLVTAVLAAGLTGYSLINRVLSGEGGAGGQANAGSSLPPPAPGRLRIARVGQSSITIQWEDRSQNETGFVVERRQGRTSPFTPLLTLSPDTSTFTDTGLSEDTQYTYRVRAAGRAGSSAYSAEQTASTFSSTPLVTRYTQLEKKAVAVHASYGSREVDKSQEEVAKLRVEADVLLDELNLREEGGEVRDAGLRSKLLGIRAYLELLGENTDIKQAAALLKSAMEVDPANQTAAILYKEVSQGRNPLGVGGRDDE